jgi:hypothetical protein
VPIADEQFNCGPAVDPLPDEDTLLSWTSEQTLDYGTESWMWGERCMIANMLNEHYFKCTLRDDKKACDDFNELLKAIRERKEAQ